jgi:hypothetical protein
MCSPPEKREKEKLITIWLQPVSFPTPYACGIARSRGLGSALGVFVTVYDVFSPISICREGTDDKDPISNSLIISALVFFLSSVAYNRLVLNKRGLDQLPTIRPTWESAKVRYP